MICEFCNNEMELWWDQYECNNCYFTIYGLFCVKRIGGITYWYNYKNNLITIKIENKLHSIMECNSLDDFISICKRNRIGNLMVFS